MATHDDGLTKSAGYSGDGRYSAGAAARHFDDDSEADYPAGAGTQYFSVDQGAHHFDDPDDPGYSSPTTALPAPTSTLDEPERAPLPWHGGADFGLLVLRLVLGGTFAAHGLQTLFGLLGGPGVTRFTAFLAENGFKHARALAWVTGVTELGGGALLVLGLFTALGAAGILGVMASVIRLKWHGGFFAPSGFEWELALATLAFTVLFTGPGRVALDNGRPWYRHPVATGFTFLVIAAGATAAVQFALR